MEIRLSGSVTHCKHYHGIHVCVFESTSVCVLRWGDTVLGRTQRGACALVVVLTLPSYSCAFLRLWEWEEQILSMVGGRGGTEKNQIFSPALPQNGGYAAR